MRFRSMAMVVLATISGITGTALVTAVPASAAVSSCTGTSLYTDAAGFQQAIPTIGNGTHQDDCELGVGNQGSAVKDLQYTLDECYLRSLTVDGIYGSQTQAAVEYAQRSVGITADGIYGPQTRDHIEWTAPGTGILCHKL